MVQFMGRETFLPHNLVSRCFISLLPDLVVQQLKLKSASMQGFIFRDENPNETPNQETQC